MDGSGSASGHSARVSDAASTGGILKRISSSSGPAPSVGFGPSVSGGALGKERPSIVRFSAAGADLNEDEGDHHIGVATRGRKIVDIKKDIFNKYYDPTAALPLMEQRTSACTTPMRSVTSSAPHSRSRSLINSRTGSVVGSIAGSDVAMGIGSGVLHGPRGGILPPPGPDATPFAIRAYQAAVRRAAAGASGGDGSGDSPGGRYGGGGGGGYGSSGKKRAVRGESVQHRATRTVSYHGPQWEQQLALEELLAKEGGWSRAEATHLKESGFVGRLQGHLTTPDLQAHAGALLALLARSAPKLLDGHATQPVLAALPGMMRYHTAPPGAPTPTTTSSPASGLLGGSASKTATGRSPSAAAAAAALFVSAVPSPGGGTAGRSTLHTASSPGGPSGGALYGSYGEEVEDLAPKRAAAALVAALVRCSPLARSDLLHSPRVLGGLKGMVARGLPDALYAAAAIADVDAHSAGVLYEAGLLPVACAALLQPRTKQSERQERDGGGLTPLQSAKLKGAALGLLAALTNSDTAAHALIKRAWVVEVAVELLSGKGSKEGDSNDDDDDDDSTGAHDNDCKSSDAASDQQQQGQRRGGGGGNSSKALPPHATLLLQHASLGLLYALASSSDAEARGAAKEALWEGGEGVTSALVGLLKAPQRQLAACTQAAYLLWTLAAGDFSTNPADRNNQLRARVAVKEAGVGALWSALSQLEGWENTPLPLWAGGEGAWVDEGVGAGAGGGGSPSALASPSPLGLRAVGGAGSPAVVGSAGTGADGFSTPRQQEQQQQTQQQAESGAGGAAGGDDDGDGVEATPAAKPELVGGAGRGGSSGGGDDDDNGIDEDIIEEDILTLPDDSVPTAAADASADVAVGEGSPRGGSAAGGSPPSPSASLARQAVRDQAQATPLPPHRSHHTSSVGSGTPTQASGAGNARTANARGAHSSTPEPGTPITPFGDPFASSEPVGILDQTLAALEAGMDCLAPSRRKQPPIQALLSFQYNAFGLMTSLALSERGAAAVLGCKGLMEGLQKRLSDAGSLEEPASAQAAAATSSTVAILQQVLSLVANLSLHTEGAAALAPADSSEGAEGDAGAGSSMVPALLRCAHTTLSHLCQPAGSSAAGSSGSVGSGVSGSGGSTPVLQGSPAAWTSCHPLLLQCMSTLVNIAKAGKGINSGSLPTDLANLSLSVLLLRPPASASPTAAASLQRAALSLLAHVLQAAAQGEEAKAAVQQLPLLLPIAHSVLLPLVGSFSSARVTATSAPYEESADHIAASCLWHALSMQLIHPDDLRAALLPKLCVIVSGGRKGPLPSSSAARDSGEGDGSPPLSQHQLLDALGLVSCFVRAHDIAVQSWSGPLPDALLHCFVRAVHEDGGSTDGDVVTAVRGVVSQMIKVAVKVVRNTRGEAEVGEPDKRVDRFNKVPALVARLQCELLVGEEEGAGVVLQPKS